MADNFHCPPFLYSHQLVESLIHRLLQHLCIYLGGLYVRMSEHLDYDLNRYAPTQGPSGKGMSADVHSEMLVNVASLRYHLQHKVAVHIRKYIEIV